MEQGQEQTLITPDFSETKDKVEVGVYNARVVASKVDQWAGKEGKPPTVYIAWTLETFGEADQKNNGRKIFLNTPINGPGAFRLKEFYKAAMGEECAGAFDREMLNTKEVTVTIGDQLDKQKQPTGYTEVKTVKAFEGAAH